MTRTFVPMYTRTLKLKAFVVSIGATQCVPNNDQNYLCFRKKERFFFMATMIVACSPTVRGLSQRWFPMVISIEDLDRDGGAEDRRIPLLRFVRRILHGVNLSALEEEAMAASVCLVMHGELLVSAICCAGDTAAHVKSRCDDYAEVVAHYRSEHPCFQPRHYMVIPPKTIEYTMIDVQRVKAAYNNRNQGDEPLIVISDWADMQKMEGWLAPTALGGGGHNGGRSVSALRLSTAEGNSTLSRRPRGSRLLADGGHSTAKKQIDRATGGGASTPPPATKGRRLEEELCAADSTPVDARALSSSDKKSSVGFSPQFGMMGGPSTYAKVESIDTINHLLQRGDILLDPRVAHLVCPVCEMLPTKPVITSCCASTQCDMCAAQNPCGICREVRDEENGEDSKAFPVSDRRLQEVRLLVKDLSVLYRDEIQASRSLHGMWDSSSHPSILGASVLSAPTNIPMLGSSPQQMLMPTVSPFHHVQSPHQQHQSGSFASPLSPASLTMQSPHLFSGGDSVLAAPHS